MATVPHYICQVCLFINLCVLCDLMKVVEDRRGKKKCLSYTWIAMETAADQSMTSPENIYLLYSTVLINWCSDIAILLAFMPFVVIVFWHLNTWHTPVIKKSDLQILSLKFLTSVYIYLHRYLFLPPNCSLNFPYILFSKLLYYHFLTPSTYLPSPLLSQTTLVQLV